MPDPFRRPTDVSKAGLNIGLATFGFAVLACFVALYVFDRALYFQILDLWSFNPFKYPFLDIEWVGAVNDCWRRGFDVYAINPCDELGRVFNYAPPWLWLGFWPTSRAWTNPIGLGIASLFILSLTLLPRPRRPIDHLPMLCALLSPMTVYAIERCNADVLMFLLVISAVTLMDRSLPARLFGYTAILTAGLLKFYPLVALILLLRERPRVFLPAAILAASATLGLFWFYHQELARILPNVPRPVIFRDAFGASQLPMGIWYLLEAIAVDTGLAAGPVSGATAHAEALPQHVTTTLLTFVLLSYIFLCRGAVRLARHPQLHAATAALTGRERISLFAGSILVCGCFLSGRSLGYRAIDLLLVLPGLFALARTAPSPTFTRIFRFAGIIGLLLMMDPVPRTWIDDRFGGIEDGGSVAAWAYWLARELGWWSLTGVLSGIVLHLVLDSQVIRSLLPLLRLPRRPGLAAAHPSIPTTG